MKATDLSPAERARKYLDKLSNAKARGIKMTVTLTEWDGLFEQHAVCYYSGKPYTSISDMTVERLDARKGYEPGNLVLCNQATNSAKAHLDAFEKVDNVDVATLIRIMSKSLYRLQKRQRAIQQLQSKQQPNALAYFKTAKKGK